MKTLYILIEIPGELNKMGLMEPFLAYYKDKGVAFSTLFDAENDIFKVQIPCTDAYGVSKIVPGDDQMGMILAPFFEIFDDFSDKILFKASKTKFI